MSFIDQRFPEKYGYGAVVTDDWLTEIVETRNRREARNAPVADPRITVDLSVTGRTSAERAELRAWHWAMNGSAHSFAFRELGDYQCSRADGGLGSGDGTTTTFQLQKTYTVGAQSYARRITKPIVSTVRVWVNGVEQLSGWSVSRTTGVLTFSSAPASGHAIEASFEFDLCVRFMHPKLSWTAVNRNATAGLMWVCPQLSLIEVLGE